MLIREKDYDVLAAINRDGKADRLELVRSYKSVTSSAQNLICAGLIEKSKQMSESGKKYKVVYSITGAGKDFLKNRTRESLAGTEETIVESFYNPTPGAVS